MYDVGHNAGYWDQRYAASGGDKHEHRLSGGPDPTLVEVAAQLPHGRALDVAAGRGRHALWLAAHGWQVTAVDFSQVAIDEGRAAEVQTAETATNDATLRQIRRRVASMRDEPGAADEPGAEPRGATPIEWVVADATTWEPAAEQERYDLILCAFFHLDDDVFPRLREWLSPGGHLLVLGHALRNLTDGVGGPTDPTYLHTEDRLRTAATGLTIERLAEVTRPTDAGPQIDLVLLARKP
jgi:SAM-dependent methyltransferase